MSWKNVCLLTRYQRFPPVRTHLRVSLSIALSASTSNNPFKLRTCFGPNCHSTQWALYHVLSTVCIMRVLGYQQPLVNCPRSWWWMSECRGVNTPGKPLMSVFNVPLTTKTSIKTSITDQTHSCQLKTSDNDFLWKSQVPGILAQSGY